MKGRRSSVAAAWRLVALAYASTALFGAALALPIAALVGVTWSGSPGGDAALFEPGGVALLETARLLARDGHALVVAAPWAMLAWAVASLVPWGAVLVTLARPRGARVVEALAGALDLFPAMSLVFGVSVVARAIAVAIGSAAISYLPDMVRTERAATYVLGVGIVLAFALHGVVRASADLAFASVAVRGGSGVRALASGPLLFRGRLFAAWLWRAFASVAVVAVAAAITGALDVRRPGSALVVALVHQAALAVVIVIRASWLGVAVDAVSATVPSGALERAAQASDR